MIEDILRDRLVTTQQTVYQKNTALKKGLQFTSTDESYLEIGSLTDIDFSAGVTVVFRGSTRDPLTNALLNSPGYNIITFVEDTSYIEIVNDCIVVNNVAGFNYTTVAADYVSGVAPFANGVVTIVITFDVFNNSMVYVLNQQGYDRLTSFQTGTFSAPTRPNVFAMAKNLTDSLDHKLAYYERWQLYNTVLTESQIFELRTNWNTVASNKIFDIGTNSSTIDSNTWYNLAVVEPIVILDQAWINFDMINDDNITYKTGTKLDQVTNIGSGVNTVKYISNRGSTGDNVYYDSVEKGLLYPAGDQNIATVFDDPAVTQVNISYINKSTYFITRPITSAGSRMIVYGAQVGHQLRYDDSNSAMLYYSSVTISFGSSIALGNKNIIQVHSTDTELILGIDDNISTHLPPNTTDTYDRLGTWSGGAFGLDGYVYQCIVFDRILSESERTQLMEELKTRWNITHF